MNTRGSKVLVTGGAGFIGSWVVHTLLEKGAEITVYDNFSSGLRKNLKDVQSDIEIIKGDILDFDRLKAACKDKDIVSHHAAQLEITKCISSPEYDLKVNTVGTLNVLRAAVANKVSKLVCASSACVYGQAQYRPEDENHPANPNWEYGISKLAQEKYCNIFSDDYLIPIASLRYSIVYGPREWFGRVLTIFIKRAVEGKPLVIFGDGSQLRDFAYVGDVVRLHNLLMESDFSGHRIYNASSGTAHSIKELAPIVQKVCQSVLKKDVDIVFEDIKEGEESRMVERRKRLPRELKAMHLDYKKANEDTGYQPQVQLEDGVKKEMEWLVAEGLQRWKRMSY